MDTPRPRSSTPASSTPPRFATWSCERPRPACSRPAGPTRSIEEWIRNLLKNNPRVSRESLERTRCLIDGAVRDCLVTGYTSLIPSLTLPDQDDRHVLAAAIQAKASVIVTFNLSVSPPTAIAPYGVEARHPDDFFAELLKTAVDALCEAVRLQRKGLRNPSMSVEDFLAKPEGAGLPRPASTLRGYANRLWKPASGIMSEARSGCDETHWGTPPVQGLAVARYAVSPLARNG